ncbi:MAG: FAD-dependent oxidoreductase [Akkermansiaceae bacterium]|nr:FAD-dependent oxidoreductase [Akkermansiaceae bacterium]
MVPPPATTGDAPRLVILGAGVCGLYAALTALERGAAVTLVEKESRPGGLAAGQQHGENFYDLGVHMLHAFDREVFDTCAAAMGDERHEVALHAEIKWAGNRYHYPLRGRDILRGIPPLTLARCLAGLFLAEIESRLARREDARDAEEALVQLYGAPLYEFFFEEFTHRYWGLHPRDLSAEFIRRKMPRLSAVDVFKNLLQKLRLANPRDTTEGALRFETLHYSATGAETLPRALAREIEARGGTILLDSEVTAVRHGGGRVTQVTTSGGATLPCEACLSTLPVPLLLAGLDPPPPRAVRESAARLRYKPIAVHGLLVAKPRCMDAHYTYFRDRRFHRVGEPKNAGLRVTPADHTVLIVETTCEEGDADWTGEGLADLLADLEAEGLCSPVEVVEHHLLRARHGYPVFSRGFEPHLAAAEDFLGTFRNLRSTGRQGAFTYPNMHGAMRMGARAAEQLLAAAPADLPGA